MLPSHQIICATNHLLFPLQQRERYVRALFDHQPVGTAYLCFRKDDIIRVFDKPDLEQGWLYGLVHEERGKFPEEYVEEYEPVRK